jgi:ferredoxin-NADP reductase
VVEAIAETPRVKSLTINVPDWTGHLAGQHVDVRLTAEDGYQATRSYSIASPPEDPRITITVEELADGEVSRYLVEDVRSGDPLEFRGPIGGYFVWEVSQGGPLLLLAGGSGIAPLMAMVRHRIAARNDAPVRLVYSTRSLEDVIYRQELERIAAEQTAIEVIHTYTRVQPPGWARYSRRIDHALLEEVMWRPDQHPLVFICGPTPFVETAATGLTELGHDPARVRTERFGPTGG